MKKIFLLFILTLFSLNFCNAQDWFTSLDVAKRMALAQNKLLFVIWETSLDYQYPLMYVYDNNNTAVVDLSKNDEIDAIIWDHFIPVLLPESKYEDLFNEAKNKGTNYIAKLDDDSIKIMDVNENVLNTNLNDFDQQNLSIIIEKYSLNTSFLKQELTNYLRKENFTTSFKLASKYLDYAIFVSKDTRFEITKLANIYFDESKQHLEDSNINNKNVFTQKLELLKIKELLILNHPKKARRLLKRIKVIEIDDINESLYSFLNYTIFKLLDDGVNAALWEVKLSSVDLKIANLILNNTQ